MQSGYRQVRLHGTNRPKNTNIISRFIAQAAHVAEMHLGESGLDFGEMQLGQAVTLDYDLDTFMVGIGFSKQCIALLIRDVGMSSSCKHLLAPSSHMK